MFKLPLTNFQNAAPGNVATIKLPAGPGTPTYDAILLELGGSLTAAHIERFTLKASGRTLIDEGSGTDLNLREAYKGVATAAGFVTLDFTEITSRNGANEQLLASIPGNLLTDLTAEIKIASGAPGTMTLKAHALFRPPTANPFVLKRLNQTISFAAAGTDAAPQSVFLPTQASGGKLKRIYMHESPAGTTTAVQIRVANNVIWESTRANMEHHQRRFGLVPQTGLVVVDFVEDGNLAGVLDTSRAVDDAQFDVRCAAATYRLFYEYIDPIGRL